MGSTYTVSLAPPLAPGRCALWRRLAAALAGCGSGCEAPLAPLTAGSASSARLTSLQRQARRPTTARIDGPGRHGRRCRRCRRRPTCGLARRPKPALPRAGTASSGSPPTRSSSRARQRRRSLGRRSGGGSCGRISRARARASRPCRCRRGAETSATARTRGCGRSTPSRAEASRRTCPRCGPSGTPTARAP